MTSTTRTFFAAIALVMMVTTALLINRPTHASQNSCILPTTGTVSGLTLVNDINACIDSQLTLYSGASAPSTPTVGWLWMDTSASPRIIRQYDGSSWNPIWYLDISNHIILMPMGTGNANISSASTMDIGADPHSFLSVTGTSTINSFGSTAPTGAKVLTFANILTLTYNGTSLILPGGGNIITAVGDSLMAVPLGSGNWRVVSYTRADGSAVKTDPQLVGAVIMGDFGVVPAKYVRGQGQAISRASFPDYFAAVTRVQTGTFTSGNATITSVADTSDLGAGMPVEGSFVNAACTILSVTSNTVVLSSSGCSIGNGSANFSVILPGYGSGGTSTTVGVKNCQGRALAGTDPSGSTLSSAALTNAALGVQSSTLSTSITVATNNLPPYTPAGSLTNVGSMTVGFGVNATAVAAGAGTNVDGFFTTFGLGTLQNPSYSINPGTLGWSGNPQGGTSDPISVSLGSVSKVQPIVTARCLVRVFASNEPANDNRPRRGLEPMAFDNRRVG